VLLARSPRKLAKLRRELVARRTLAAAVVGGGQSSHSRQSCRAASSIILFDVPAWMGCYERLLRMSLEARGAVRADAQRKDTRHGARVTVDGLRSYHLIVA
jgi:hypothetical protein